MKFIRDLGSLIVVSLLFSLNSFALDRCEADFQRGLVEMKALFMRMSPPCRKEVNLGESNQDNILAACSSEEIQLALSMQSIQEDRLTPLCQAGSCSSLHVRGVCVQGKPFTYYLAKFNL